MSVDNIYYVEDTWCQYEDRVSFIDWLNNKASEDFKLVFCERYIRHGVIESVYCIFQK